MLNGVPCLIGIIETIFWKAISAPSVDFSPHTTVHEDLSHGFVKDAERQLIIF